MSKLDEFWIYFAYGGREREWAGFKHDFGHAATAAVVAYLLILLGVPALWATVAGTVGLPIVAETVDRFRWGPWGWDSVSDVISYQFLWLGYLACTGHPWWALGLLPVLFIAYVLVVIEKLP